ncbi:MAG: hypothetical protein QGG73_03345 [Candidatus Hydrogenedentes bacterium]|jgi:hypothetical protein|nr:hypothetical protein [Candidatus Hydrogenedentota bacterium]
MNAKGANARHNAVFALSFAAVLILGSVQGNRIHEIGEDQLFYRWLLSAGNQIPLATNESLEFDEGDGSALVDPMDDELFGAIQAVAEGLLPEVPFDEQKDMSRETGEPYSKLIRAARLEDGGLDEDLWKLARAPELSEYCLEFHGYLTSNRLQSAGTQFAASALYQGEGNQVQGVGVTNLFLGFRKLAANFLWLQVDKFWHEGQTHRMIPAMKSCVMLDPSFVDAYLLGAWHLAYNVTAQLEMTPNELKKWSDRYQRYMGVRDNWYFMAAEFLKDGARNNPRDYRLYFDLGYAVYEQKIKDHENAARYIGESRRYYHDIWADRMYFLALTLNGQYEESIAGWEWYMDPDKGGFPGHLTGTRSIQMNNAYLAEVRQEEALECGEAARAFAVEAEKRGDGEEARKALAVAGESELSAREESSKAIGIWDSLLRASDDDSLALSRLARFEALDLWSKGNWQEALAVLQHASFEAVTYFDDMADLMIEIKLSINEDDPNYDDLVITTSERLEIERRARVADRRKTLKKRERRVPCDYI